MGDHGNRSDGKPVEHDREIICHVRLVVTIIGSRAPTGTAQIRAQHPVAIGRQRTDQLMPCPPVLRETVDKHDRRTVGRSGVGDVNRDTAAHVDEPVLHAGEHRQ
ncbi:hypothetical protein MLGJGCBP_04553 [Rhodococcus sp. T7]|nr:hypothetical protein MLGJGCBP_04553 [Rhodococcus sp. T7]